MTMPSTTSTRTHITKLLHSLSLAVHRSWSAVHSWRGRSHLSGTRKVVIFDKDGTLIDIHAQWAPWIRTLVASIELEVNLNIAVRAYEELSFDQETSRVLPGILGEGTMEMIKECLSTILQEEGDIPRSRADKVVEACLEACCSLKSGVVKSIGDTAKMFRRLRRKGYCIAINTSDSRITTLKTLHELGVSELVDVVVCGDDDWMIVKPHPVSAETICAQLAVLPENAVMIGDSPCDVRLGTNANLACAIGVLTGIAPRKALEDDATVIVENVMGAVDLILSNDLKHGSTSPVSSTSRVQQDLAVLAM